MSIALVGKPLFRRAIIKKRIPKINRKSNDLKPRDKTATKGRRRATVYPAYIDIITNDSYVNMTEIP
jgi:hypothetical protein